MKKLMALSLLVMILSGSVSIGETINYTKAEIGYLSFEYNAAYPLTEKSEGGISIALEEGMAYLDAVELDFEVGVDMARLLFGVAATKPFEENGGQITDQGELELNGITANYASGIFEYTEKTLFCTHIALMHNNIIYRISYYYDTSINNADDDKFGADIFHLFETITLGE